MNQLPSAMQHKLLTLALIPCLLNACGGGSNDDMSNPGDNRPSTDNQKTFEASKVREISLNGAGTTEPFRLSASGATLVEHSAKTVRIDARSLPAGFVSRSGTVTFPNYRNTSYPATVRSYQGFQSGIFIAHSDQSGVFANFADYGTYTKADQLPQSGKATYRGVAFDRADRGTLTYHVDFAARQGEGQIDGLPRYDGTITLRRAGFQTHGDGAIGIMGGVANTRRDNTLRYQARFSGAGAEELVGAVYDSGITDFVGFHGTRGEISQ